MLFHVLGYADDLGFAIEWDMVIFTAHNRIPPFQYSFAAPQLFSVCRFHYLTWVQPFSMGI